MATYAPTPNFINERLLQKALAKAHPGGGIVVKKVTAKLNETNGENFCSDIYRVFVKYEVYGLPYEKRFVLKDMDMEVAALGSSEFSMYEKVLPFMEGLRGQDQVRFSARCFLQQRNGKEFYLLEDLSAAGYRIVDRQNGLDAEHAKRLLTKLGQFHGTSCAYIENHRETLATDLHAAHFAQGASDSIAASITFGGMEHAIGVISEWPGFEGIVEKMRTNVKRFDERVKVLVDPDCVPIQVIVHGDLWVNNFLYRYDEDQQVEDVLFVDYQNCFLGSPGYDLNYFIYTSVRLDVIEMELEELLRSYYAAFSGSLRACRVAHIPRWEDILTEFHRMAFIGYYAAVCELPVCCMTPAVSGDFTAATFDDATAMSVKRRQMYEGNERVMAMLRYILPFFNAQGVLD